MNPSQISEPATVTERRVVTGLDQLSSPVGRILHSGNSGVLIHRSGAFRYEFAEEGYRFSVDLLAHLNSTQAGVATTLCYAEVLGSRDRVHWFVHLRSLDEYKKLIHAVDHDQELQEISRVDRLPEKGHGNWERIFVESSIRERVLVPQHGLTQFANAPFDPDGYFAAPAQNQTAQPLDQQLNSATAGAVVLRTGVVRYAFREEGRLYWYDWQEFVNRELAGSVTCFLYEETFGHQDTLHCLIQLRDLGDHQALLDLERSPAMRERIHARQRIHDAKGGGTGEKLFLDGTIHDTLLVPCAGSRASRR
ncbi:MAG TPA: DUF6039 family protein [Kineosporiaceae bacterium]